MRHIVQHRHHWISVSSLIPGYITLRRERTADEIAGDLKLASEIKPDTDTSSVTEAFSALVAKRDSLLLAHPIPATDNSQILNSLGDTVGQDWAIDDLWAFAEEAQNVALAAQKLIPPAKTMPVGPSIVKEGATPSTPLDDLAFAERWRIDDLPACTVGVSFLRRLSENAPRLYAMAERTGFSDPADAELTTHPLWMAFVDHYAACGDCNEV